MINERCYLFISNTGNSVYLCVRLFNSSETARGTSIKLGAINYHPVVSVMRFVMP